MWQKIYDTINVAVGLIAIATLAFFLWPLVLFIVGWFVLWLALLFLFGLGFALKEADHPIVSIVYFIFLFIGLIGFATYQFLSVMQR